MRSPRRLDVSFVFHRHFNNSRLRAAEVPSLTNSPCLTAGKLVFKTNFSYAGMLDSGKESRNECGIVDNRHVANVSHKER